MPRTRADVFLPVLTPWEDGDRKIAAVRSTYAALPATWDDEVEDRIFAVLFDVFGQRKHHATDLPAIKPTVAEILAQPTNLTFRLRCYDPDYPVYDYDDILDCAEEVAELEALHRWSMVLHNQYPWDRSRGELVEVGELSDDDYVVVFHPRDRAGRAFLRRLPRRRAGAPVDRARPGDGAGARLPTGQRADAVRGDAAHRVAGRGSRRTRLHATTT